MWPPKCFSMKGVSICEPSSGEIGSRLKTARVILICIKIIKKVFISGERNPLFNDIRKITALKTANNKFYFFQI